MPTFLKTLAVFLITRLFCCVSINAQANELMTDWSGKPMYLKIDFNIEGSPYYPEDYYKASIYTREGKVYKGINVRFNIMENQLLMKRDEAELVVTSPITRVIFTENDKPGMLNTVFEKGFPRTGQQNEQTYYEVLDSGRVKLLKQRSSHYDDKTYYGLAGITRVFETKVTYYMFADGKMNKLDKGKDGLLSLISEKKEELNKYIDEKQLKCRTESDWNDAIAYYNSLFKSP